MLLTSSQIQSLKQSNISADIDKTKERVEALWKTAKSAQKQEIRTLVDIVPATVYRIYKTGSISAKLAIAFAQTLNVNPFYLTGEADESGEFAEADLLRLLEQQNYKKLLAELAAAEPEPKAKRPYTRRKKAEPEDTPVEEILPVEAPEQAEEKPVIAEISEEVPAEIAAPIAPALPENDLQALLHALVIRANADAASAADKLSQVQGILLS